MSAAAIRHKARVAELPSEHVEQVRLFRWALYARGTHPELRLLYAIPNGGARHIAVAAKLKAEGVRPGVPDICLPVARGGRHGLYIELKRQKGARPSPEQDDWLTALNRAGYLAVWCRGWELAAAQIETYLGETTE